MYMLYIEDVELLTLPEHLNSPPVFSGVRVTRSLVLLRKQAKHKSTRKHTKLKRWATQISPKPGDEHWTCFSSPRLLDW